MLYNELGRDRTSSPSAWGLRLLAALSLVLAVSLVWIWIETYYRGISVNVQLTFKSFDVPVIAGSSLYAAPVIGHHYFGDFQVPLSYAWDLRNGISPYLRTAPGQYPPFSQLLFLPFTTLNLRAGAAVYLTFSAATFLVPLWLLLAPLRAAARVVFLVPAAVLTTGFISFLDRGNSVGIVVGLMAWALWAWKTERWVLCAVFLTACIGLKAYPAALLVVPLALRRYKFTAVVASAVVVSNLIILAFYPGGFLNNLREIVPAMKGDSNPAYLMVSWSLYSVIPKTAGLLFGQSAADGLLEPATALLWLPSLLYVAGLYFVIRRGRVPQWCWGPLALATAQLVVPASFTYTTAWSAVAAVWYVNGALVDAGREHDEIDGEHTVLRVLLLLALTATLAPSVFTVSGAGGFEAPVAMFLSPILVTLTLCVAVVESLRAPKSEAAPDEGGRPAPGGLSTGQLGLL